MDQNPVGELLEPVAPERAAQRHDAAPRGLRARLSGPGLWLAVFMVAFVLFTRLFNLGLKPVQHDESMFAYYSYLITDKYQNMPQAPLLQRPHQFMESLVGYEYMPIMHGPVLEIATALVFWALGDSDYTMRLLPALCGIAIIGVLLLLRDHIGRKPAYWGAAMLAICPTMVYFNRYIRPDMLCLLTYMLIIFVGMKYRKKPTWIRITTLVVLIAFISCIHETYVIFMFFLTTFLLGCWIHGMVRRKDWIELGVGSLGLLALAYLARKGVHDQPKIGPPSVSGGTPEVPPMQWAKFIPLVVGVFVMAGLLWIHSFLTRKDHRLWKRTDYRDIPFYNEFRKAIFPHFWAVGLGCFLGAWLSVGLMTMSFSKYNPVDNEGKRISAPAHIKLAYDNYAKTLPAGEKPNLKEFAFNYLDQNVKHWNGQYEAYIYWKGQHEEHRIKGAFHFYWLHLMLYELPFTAFWVAMLFAAVWPVSGMRRAGMWRGIYLAILAAVLAAMFLPAAWFTKTPTDQRLWNFAFSKELDAKIHMTLGLHVWLFFVPLILVMIAGWVRLGRGRYFHAFADYWTVGSLLAYGFAGEKVPWLTAHIALPMMMSLGFYVSDYIGGVAARLRPALSFNPLDAPVPVPLPMAPTSASASARKRSGGKTRRIGEADDASGKPPAASEQNKNPSAKTPAPPARKSISIPKHSAAGGSPWGEFMPGAAALPGLGQWLRPSILSRMQWRDIFGVGYLILGAAFTIYTLVVTSFIQPGSPAERHSYASSHTHFHQAMHFILDRIEHDPKVIQAIEQEKTAQVARGEKPRTFYPTVIALEGTMEWPVHWILRHYNKKTFPKVAADTVADYIIVDYTILDAKPAYMDRYEWSPRIRFRHYWVPQALKVGDMFRFGLLLSSDESLKAKDLAANEARTLALKGADPTKPAPAIPESKQYDSKQSMLLQWRRIWKGLVLRDEEALRPEGSTPWPEIGGFDVYFGRRKGLPIPDRAN